MVIFGRGHYVTYHKYHQTKIEPSGRKKKETISRWCFVHFCVVQRAKQREYTVDVSLRHVCGIDSYPSPTYQEMTTCSVLLIAQRVIRLEKKHRPELHLYN